MIQIGRGRAQRPEEPISPTGRSAASITLGCVFVMGLVYSIDAWMVFACTRRCHANPAVGGLVLMLAVAACILAAELGRQALRRPVDDAGGSGWSYGLSVIFSIGVLAAITRIPDLTCPDGSYLSAFGYCSGAHDARLDPSSWIWLKDLIAITGLALAAALIPVRRLAVVTTPLAAAVWFLGTGLFLGKLL